MSSRARWCWVTLIASNTCSKTAALWRRQDTDWSSKSTRKRPASVRLPASTGDSPVTTGTGTAGWWWRVFGTRLNSLLDSVVTDVWHSSRNCSIPSALCRAEFDVRQSTCSPTTYTNTSPPTAMNIILCLYGRDGVIGKQCIPSCPSAMGLGIQYLA